MMLVSFSDKTIGASCGAGRYQRGKSKMVSNTMANKKGEKDQQ
jgi:hypothetical protein